MERELEPGWRPWPVWSAVWVGALSALAVGLIIGLIGYAIGAHQLTAPRTMTFRNVHLITTIFSVAGAFFAFAVGGWVAGTMAGFRRSEPAILHGVIAWLVTIPMMLAAWRGRRHGHVGRLVRRADRLTGVDGDAADHPGDRRRCS